MKILYFPFLVLLFSCSFFFASAQITNQHNPGVITGSIIDANTHNPVSFAGVALLKQSDSSIVTGVQAAESGIFRLDNIPFGEYELQIRFMGYKVMMIKDIHVRKEKNEFNLNEIQLAPDSKMLKEVVVYEEKPLIETQGSKLIYNASESVLNTGAMALDVLRNVPMITVDLDGNVKLLGKDPIILIDGKQSDLNVQQINDILQSISGDAIEKIEVMTNPPAKYKTDGGGVINIILKKGYKIGLNGRTSFSAGTRGIFMNNTYVGYRDKKMILSLNYSGHYSEYKNNGYTFNQSITDNTASYLRQYNNGYNHNFSNYLRLAFDYDFDNKNSIQVIASGNLYKNYSRNLFAYNQLDDSKQTVDTSRKDNKITGNSNYENLNVEYKHKFKKRDNDITIGGYYEPNSSHNNSNYLQQFFNPDNTQNGVDSLYKNNRDEREYRLVGYVDYNMPFNDSISSISTGIRSTGDINRDNFLAQNFNYTTNDYEKDNLLSNNFRYNQFVTSAYFTFASKIKKKIGYEIGGRLEQAKFVIQFPDNPALNTTRNYLNFLPTINVNYTLRKKYNFRLSYRRYVQRPGIYEMNPFVDYSNSYNISYGNPYLKPTASNNYNLSVSSFTPKFNVNASLYYSTDKNISEQIRQPLGDAKFSTTWENIASSRSFGLSLYGGYHFTKALSANVNFNMSGTNYQQSSTASSMAFKNGFGAYIYSNLQYKLNKRLSLEANLSYYNEASPQGRSYSHASEAFGAEYSIFNNKGSLNVRVTDPFAGSSSTSHYSGTNFNIETYNNYRTTNITFTISYKFTRAGANTFNRQKRDNNQYQRVYFGY